MSHVINIQVYGNFYVLMYLYVGKVAKAENNFQSWKQAKLQILKTFYFLRGRIRRDSPALLADILKDITHATVQADRYEYEHMYVYLCIRICVCVSVLVVGVTMCQSS